MYVTSFCSILHDNNKSLMVVGLTLTHRYNALRGHRTGSNKSGAEAFLRKEIHKNRIIHTRTETNRMQ